VGYLEYSFHSIGQGIVMKSKGQHKHMSLRLSKHIQKLENNHYYSPQLLLMTSKLFYVNMQIIAFKWTNLICKLFAVLNVNMSIGWGEGASRNWITACVMDFAFNRQGRGVGAAVTLQHVINTIYIQGT